MLFFVVNRSSSCVQMVSFNVNKTCHVIQRNIEARSCNHFCSGKTIIITYSECVFIAWGTQHAPHMSHIVICGVFGSYNIFTRYFINCTIFRKVFGHKMCVWIFPANFACNICKSEKNWCRYIKNVHCCPLKYSLFLSDFNETLIFSIHFRRMLKHRTSWKSGQWELNCSMRTDRRIDKHDEARNRFSQFCWRT